MRQKDERIPLRRLLKSALLQGDRLVQLSLFMVVLFLIVFTALFAALVVQTVVGKAVAESASVSSPPMADEGQDNGDPTAWLRANLGGPSRTVPATH